MQLKSIVAGTAVMALLVIGIVIYGPNQSKQVDNTEVAALLQIQARGKLRVGVDIPYGVMEYYGRNGIEAGIDIDIVREFCRRLGVEPVFVTMPFENCLPRFMISA